MSDHGSILPELLKHYPWLPSLKDIYRDIALKEPVEFVEKIFKNQEYNHIIDRTAEFFRTAFENIEDFPTYNKDQYNISFYLLLRIMLYLLGNNRIINRLANLFSKITYNDMKNEIMNGKLFNLYHICIDLDIDIDYLNKEEVYHTNLIKDQKEEIKTNFKIYFTDYLKIASNLKDDYRKLVNNALSGGYVYIKPKDLARLIQEYVRGKFLEINSFDKSNLENMRETLFSVKSFKTIYDDILNLWELKKEDFEFSVQIKYEKGKNITSNFPPCIKDILLNIKEGQNISHIGRLFFTFFLIALDYPIEMIIELFSTLPDFDLEKTNYQVKFAKRKGYVPHSCATLKSLNLCLASKYKDELCLKGYYSKKKDSEQKIKHPLFYIQYKQYKTSKTQNE